LRRRYGEKATGGLSERSCREQRKGEQKEEYSRGERVGIVGDEIHDELSRVGESEEVEKVMGEEERQREREEVKKERTRKAMSVRSSAPKTAIPQIVDIGDAAAGTYADVDK
jgi:hypothetical protein